MGTRDLVNGFSTTMQPAHLRDVLIAELSDALGADRRLLDAWPVLADAASAQTLKRFCAEGVDYTRERLRRLETAFSILQAHSAASSADAIGCLIKAALDVAGAGDAGPVRDAALLAGIQKLSHYGHASYASIVGFAETLEEDLKTYDGLPDGIKNPAHDAMLDRIRVDVATLRALRVKFLTTGVPNV